MSTKILFYSMFVGLVFVCMQSQAMGAGDLDQRGRSTNKPKDSKAKSNKKGHSSRSRSRSKSVGKQPADSTDSTTTSPKATRSNLSNESNQISEKDSHVGPANQTNSPELQFKNSRENPLADEKAKGDIKTPKNNDDGKGLKKNPKNGSNETTRSWCRCWCPLKVVLGTGAVAIGCYATYRLALYIFKNKTEEEETDEPTEPTTLSTSTTDQTPVSE